MTYRDKRTAPETVGVYQVDMHPVYPRYRYWNGTMWGWVSDSVEDAPKQPAFWPPDFMPDRWKEIEGEQ